MLHSENAQSEPGILKALTGIAGFDSMTGGLPIGRTSLIVGEPGAGKTVFALQVLHHVARHRDEPGLFVAFEEDSSEVINNAASFGWNLPELIDRRLFFLDARVAPDIAMGGAFDLTGLLSALGAKARDMGAKWIVFDAIDTLLTLLDDPAAERRELYRLREWLAHSGLTGILTGKRDSQDSSQFKDYGILQFMVDCVIELSRSRNGRNHVRELAVRKYRGSGFAEGVASLVFGKQGIEVGGTDLVGRLLDYRVFKETVSSGLPSLDAMLVGGYYRGSSILVTGLPGTAKTTLAGLFLASICANGEHAVFISFDESADEIVRNLGSVGIDLQTHRDQGRLHMHSLRAESGNAEEHLLHIGHLIALHKPAALVIDPISALVAASMGDIAFGVAKRLIVAAKEAGITLLCTSLTEVSEPLVESSRLQISTIADTWIHLAYRIDGGERNRALSIVKARGIGHSNQVRELLLGNAGPQLAEVYTEGGEVLMGTLRWEHEQAQTRERERARRQREGRLRELQMETGDLEARLALLQQEIEIKRANIETLANEDTDEKNQDQRERAERLKLRRGKVEN